VAWE
jgi:hypothetical protein